MEDKSRPCRAGAQQSPAWARAATCARPCARAAATRRGPALAEASERTRSPMIQRAAAASGRVPFTPVLDSRATASRTTRTSRAKRPSCRRFRARADSAAPRARSRGRDEGGGADCHGETPSVGESRQRARCAVTLAPNTAAVNELRDTASARTCSGPSWGRLRRTGRAPIVHHKSRNRFQLSSLG